MDESRKRIIATELLRLTRFGRPPDFDGASETMKDSLLRMSEKQFDLMTNLYVKHFTEDQLQAQLDFYKGEMGTSILRASMKVQDEFQQQLRMLAE